MPATSAIVQSTGDDQWAIGYVGLGYLADAGDKVKGLIVDGVAPSEATVLDGSYTISRPLHLYINGEPTGTIKKFVDFTMSEAGRKIVKEQGYVTVD